MRGAAAIAATAAVVGVAALIGSACAVEVRVMTVRASERGQCDPALASLKPRLRRLVGYRSYRVLHDERREVAMHREARFAIPSGQTLRLVPKGIEDETVMMRVLLLDGRRRLIDTDVRIVNRGTVLFGVARDRERADGALIILLRAEE